MRVWFISVTMKESTFITQFVENCHSKQSLQGDLKWANSLLTSFATVKALHNEEDM